MQIPGPVLSLPEHFRCQVQNRNTGVRLTPDYPERDITGSPGEVENLLIRSGREPVDKGGLPDPVHAS